MDPSDYPNVLDSAEYITVSDPYFGLIATILIFGTFIIWLLNKD